MPNDIGKSGVAPTESKASFGNNLPFGHSESAAFLGETEHESGNLFPNDA
jgi:hypothetical protein